MKSLLSIALILSFILMSCGNPSEMDSTSKSSLQEIDTQTESEMTEVAEVANMESAEFAPYVINFKERVWNPAKGEHSEWKDVPVKVLSYPLTKLQYDVPNFLTSVVTESVNRSPWHNFLGTIDETKQSFTAVNNGVLDMGKGILNPTNGAIVDGIMEVADGIFNVVQIGSGLVKTVASAVGYPIYRLMGGKPSKRAEGFRGKQAAIVSIDSAVPLPVVARTADMYGESIVKYHLKGLVDYYCAYSDTTDYLSFSWNYESRSQAQECLDNMPDDIETVHMIALTHSGGRYRMDSLMSELKSRNDNIKPGLMMSIGCYDGLSDFTSSENAMGQSGFSWAVHYYLSNAISKRLRGIPMERAAVNAYFEGIAFPNYVNPVSLGSLLAVRSFRGSFPKAGMYYNQEQYQENRQETK